MSSDREDKARDARARRAARSAGFIATKSRWRVGSTDNYGDFMIVDPRTNGAVAGTRFNMSAEDVIDWAKDE